MCESSRWASALSTQEPEVRNVGPQSESTTQRLSAKPDPLMGEIHCIEESKDQYWEGIRLSEREAAKAETAP
jgi:hypothetical protein